MLIIKVDVWLNRGLFGKKYSMSFLAGKLKEGRGEFSSIYRRFFPTIPQFSREKKDILLIWFSGFFTAKLQSVLLMNLSMIIITLLYDYDVTRSDRDQWNRSILEISQESFDVIGHCRFLWPQSEFDMTKTTP